MPEAVLSITFDVGFSVMLVILSTLAMLTGILMLQNLAWPPG